MVNEMLLEMLQGIEDQRSYHGKEYELGHIIYFSLFAILCNAKTYTQLALFIQGHFSELKEIFHLKWRRPPTRPLENPRGPGR
jgi:hypothetical protein